MKMERAAGANGFTLIEILVVIAIVGILAGLIIPMAGNAASNAKKRKAEMEASALKVAVAEFHRDHHYMPYGNISSGRGVVGDDKWIKTDDTDWVEMLQGENALKKSYLSAKVQDDGKFMDPWGNPYWVGMDRNQDGYVEGNGGPSGGAGKIIRDSVGVFCLGEDGVAGTDDDVGTDSWAND